MDTRDYNLVGAGDVSEQPIPIQMVTEANWPQWRAGAGAIPNKWIDNVQFFPKHAEVCLVPDSEGSLALVLVGAGTEVGLWSLADLPRKLPQGNYIIDPEALPISPLGGLALGWAMGAYQFDRYKKAPH